MIKARYSKEKFAIERKKMSFIIGVVILIHLSRWPRPDCFESHHISGQKLGPGLDENKEIKKIAVDQWLLSGNVAKVLIG